jgi:hypothetical protein
MAEKNEHAIAQGVIESLRLLDDESLKTKVRVRGQELVFRSEEIEANALEMVRLCERIGELGIAPSAAGVSEREKELESELKMSQLVRNELRMEFEEMRDRHEESQISAFFFQIMFEFDTAETKSLTVEQFDKKIQGFFTRFNDLYPLDKQKSSDEAKRVWKLVMICVHPYKNSNDPFAGEKFKASTRRTSSLKSKKRLNL